jgi:hypothetical protein
MKETMHDEHTLNDMRWYGIEPLYVIELLLFVLVHCHDTIENIKMYDCSNSRCRFWK